MDHSDTSRAPPLQRRPPSKITTNSGFDTPDELAALLDSIGDVVAVLDEGDDTDKADLYRRLVLRNGDPFTTSHLNLGRFGLSQQHKPSKISEDPA